MWRISSHSLRLLPAMLVTLCLSAECLANPVQRELTALTLLPVLFSVDVARSIRSWMPGLLTMEVHHAGQVGSSLIPGGCLDRQWLADQSRARGCRGAGDAADRAAEPGVDGLRPRLRYGAR